MVKVFARAGDAEQHLGLVPRVIASTSSWIARGWSPVGHYALVSWNRAWRS